MNEPIPTWWLVLSGIFFALNIVLFAALTVLAFKIIEFQREMRPKVLELTDKVNSIAENVDELSGQVKELVSNVGGRAKSIAGSTDTIAHAAAHQFERFSPIVGGVMMALRLFSVLRDFRRASQEKEMKRKVKQARELDKTLAKKR